MIGGDFMEANIKPDVELDAQGVQCPLPILRTKKMLAGMSSGQVLKVWVTDPDALNDFSAFARHTGNVLLQHSETNGVYQFVLRRK